MPSRIAFVSGPIDATEDYFHTHYTPRLRNAAEQGDSFVIGPVAGIDTFALHFLLTLAPSSRVSIYMAEFEFIDGKRRKAYEDLGVKAVDTGAATTRERDAAMTRNSDYDILRYRTERECKELYGPMWYPRVSNTEVNERRRVAKDTGQKISYAYVLHMDDAVPVMPTSLVEPSQAVVSGADDSRVLSTQAASSNSESSLFDRLKALGKVRKARPDLSPSR